MEPIYIPHLLKAPKRTAEIIVDDSISGLDTLSFPSGEEYLYATEVIF